ncbi:MAG: SMP-30/gluconolactonase/LRE family protein [Faecalibacterium sp.]|jgi:sugar lactone lactonase YvrE|nr:SMP-30/gluconolactonase/LRE family protein [Faecalibacterium sp.]
MKLGFSELLLILLILLIVFGPTVIPRVQRWYRRTGARQQRAERRRAQMHAQACAARDALLTRFSVAAGIVLVGAAVIWAGYLLFAPCAFAPQRYEANAYSMQYSADSTGTSQALDISPYQNPICVVQQDGFLYAAVDGGKVIRIRPDGTGLDEVLSTGGAVTGLGFAPDGTLYLTDAAASGTLAGGGALLKASFDGWAVSVEPVVTTIDGRRLACPSALTIGPDGTVYFADFSAVPASAHGLENAFDTELLAHTATGTIYAYDPTAQKAVCVAQNIAGAGGLALDESGETLYFSETENYRVWSVAASARGADVAAGEAKLMLDGLPGYPAGLARGEGGEIWVSVCGSRKSWVDGAAQNTLLRRIVMHLPRMTQGWLLRPENQLGRAYAFSADGNIAQTAIYKGEGCRGRITGVCPTEDGWWLANADGSSLYFTA